MDVRCFYCNEPVDPTDGTNYRRLVGWERKAPLGTSRRGGSDIVLRRHTDDYACFGCVEKLRAGLDTNQRGLFA